MGGVQRAALRYRRASRRHDNLRGSKQTFNAVLDLPAEENTTSPHLISYTTYSSETAASALLIKYKTGDRIRSPNRADRRPYAVPWNPDVPASIHVVAVMNSGDVTCVPATQTPASDHAVGHAITRN